MKARKMLPLPDNLAYHSEFVSGHGRFEVGESVWVDGWPRSKAATYRLHRVLVRDGTDVPDVQVAYDHRGTRQIHSVAPDRIRKRRDRRDK